MRRCFQTPPRARESYVGRRDVFAWCCSWSWLGTSGEPARDRMLSRFSYTRDALCAPSLSLHLEPGNEAQAPAMCTAAGAALTVYVCVT